MSDIFEAFLFSQAKLDINQLRRVSTLVQLPPSSTRLKRSHLTRRGFVISSASFLAMGLPRIGLATEMDVKNAIFTDFGALDLDDGPIHIDMPHYSDSGVSVPLTLSVPRDMQADDYPEVIGLYGDRNPRPRIAKIYLTPMCSAAKFSTRLRIKAYQNIVAVTKMRSGALFSASRKVDVTLGACEDAVASDQFPPGWTPRIKVAVPKKVEVNGSIEVRTIIGHPMETGLRRDVSGLLVPIRIAEWVRCYVNGQLAFSVKMEPAIAANPYFAFRLNISEASKLDFEWIDTNSDVYKVERDIAVS